MEAQFGCALINSEFGSARHTNGLGFAKWFIGVGEGYSNGIRVREYMISVVWCPNCSFN